MLMHFDILINVYNKKTVEIQANKQTFQLSKKTIVMS